MFALELSHVGQHTLMFNPEEAATAFRDLWWDKLVKAALPRKVFKGAELLGVVGSHSLIVLSLAHVSSFWSLVHVIPLTMFSWAVFCHVSVLLVKSHTLMTLPRILASLNPSQA
jgi:hypothetical protein